MTYENLPTVNKTNFGSLVAPYYENINHRIGQFQNISHFLHQSNSN